VHATELLELQPQGRIVGDVFYKMLEMHGGAMVTGKLTHQTGDEPVFHLAGEAAGESAVARALAEAASQRRKA
jgi:cytoskeletal protein CcmA (bactofilin family)